MAWHDSRVTAVLDNKTNFAAACKGPSGLRLLAIDLKNSSLESRIWPVAHYPHTLHFSHKWPSSGYLPYRRRYSLIGNLFRNDKSLAPYRECLGRESSQNER